MKRRQVLTGGSALLLFTAGCSTQQPSDTDNPPADGDPTTVTPTTACPDSTPTPTPPATLSIPFEVVNRAADQRQATVTISGNTSKDAIFSWTFELQPGEEWTASKTVFEEGEVPTGDDTTTQLSVETGGGETTTTTIRDGLETWRELSELGLVLIFGSENVGITFRHSDPGYTPQRCR